MRTITSDDLVIIVGREGPKQHWHLSISHRDRYPTWDEITRARYTLVPDNVTMAMILPPKSEYVNLCKTCFHLWQISSETGRQEPDQPDSD